jgi:ABC-2 type transport system ATP-binding protein
MGEPAIEVRGLRKSFGAKEALAGIDLEIAAGSLAAQLLGVLDLTQDAKRLVADYSTGMRKKAMLGCALIHNPSVLFLDEPLEGVDPVSTVLFSSHVMELVEQICDHVSIIDKGRIVATGTTDQVRDDKTLQQAFVDLVGSRANDQEVLSWLGSLSN